MDTATIARVQEAFWWTLGVGLLIGLYFYLSQPAYDGGPTRWARWKVALETWRLSRVSSDEDMPSVELPEQTSRPQAAGIKEPVSKPVSVLGTDTDGFDLAAVPPDLTYEEIVTILAVQATPTGKPLYSGRKIYSLVGGNYNGFSALMRELRAKDDAPAEPPPTVTPIAGRPTRATFQESDPDLVRQPLP